MCGDFQGEQKLRISAKTRKNGSTDIYIYIYIYIYIKWGKKQYPNLNRVMIQLGFLKISLSNELLNEIRGIEI